MEGHEEETRMIKVGLVPSRRAQPGENTCRKSTAGQDEMNSKCRFKNKKTGATGWLSGLKPLPSAQVMNSGSWDRAPHRALCSAGSLLPPFLSLPASLPTCDHSLCVK